MAPKGVRSVRKITCPACGSSRHYKDGVRVLADGSEVQRWLCRDCGYRFSGSKVQQHAPSKDLKDIRNNTGNRQICVSETKNLTPATELKTVAGDRKKKPRHIDLLPADVRGLITKFMAYLEREGFVEDIKYPGTLIHLVRDGADLLAPESVKKVIAKQRKRNGEPWSDSMKLLAVYAYDAFCKMEGIAWKRPKYRQNEATIMVPDEKDLDLLIAAGSKRMSTFLLCLKETFADPSEILRAEWIDLKDNVLSINHPVKYHYPGKYELSARLTHMLNALPRYDKRIFPTSYAAIFMCLVSLRRKAAHKFHNPALLQISFKSFRHWGGSMLAYLTNGNVPVMARILRHKSWRSTQKYVHTIEFKEEDYEVTQASTPEEILALGEAGWAKFDELTFNGIQLHFYRRPKRFRSLKDIEDKTKTFRLNTYSK
jgi:integrase